MTQLKNAAYFCTYLDIQEDTEEKAEGIERC